MGNNDQPVICCSQPDPAGMEVRGVYDGILYWFCRNCSEMWHRWAEGHRLHEKASHWMDIHARRDALREEAGADSQSDGQ